MATYKTPGVYVEEISLFPPSIAEVATAIPAFVGYTKSARRNGENLIGKPTRITSILEYRAYFCGDDINDPDYPPTITATIDKTKNFAVADIDVQRFYMHDSLRLFFDNGGGSCYIVSIGIFPANGVAGVKKDDFEGANGLQALAKYDEPTMIVMPDAVILDAGNLSSLQVSVLQQCAKLQDRVGIFDLPNIDNQKPTTRERVDEFRSGPIGINNLKYGAVYAPWLITAYGKEIPFTVFTSPDLTYTGFDAADKKGQLLELGPTPSSETNPDPEKDKDYIKLKELLTQLINNSAAKTPDLNADADQAAITATINGFLVAPGTSLQTSFKDLRDALNSVSLPADPDPDPEAMRATDDDAKAKLKALVEFLRTVAVGKSANGSTTLGVVDWHTPHTPAPDKIKGGNLKRQIETLAAQVFKPAVDALVALEKNAEIRGLLSTPEVPSQGGNPAIPAVNRDLAAVSADYANLVPAWSSKTPADTTADPQSFATDDNGSLVPVYLRARHFGTHLAPIFDGLDAFVTAVQAAALEETQPATSTLTPDEITQRQNTLYSRYPNFGDIVRQLKQKLSEMPPSGAIAGIYAYVDNSRGVWKAPANVSVAQVLAPVEIIDDAGQEDLNVDVTGGKSINAIRSFTGRGTLVWGARTLAGNDNEWRYISVRRFFNMVEESVKKSTAWAVFEPNDAMLWIRVRGMIENYLILKWRDGALAGGKPEDAFFVKVGLGQTMTALDILEGRLIIEIGMAAVRPAEFIILKFSHLMQKS
ncbi:MAG: phage tail sheath C-terminal domain-containing protein [Candidatus Methylumidiphilus sp.]